MAGDETKGHRQRLRERYIADNQLESFKPYEVLELLLFYSIPRADTKPVAKALIERFGSFSAVLEASEDELMKVEGVGEKSAILLKLVLNMFRYYRTDKVKNLTDLSSTEKMGKFLGPKYIGQTDEIVYLICLDSNGHLISCEKVSEGTVNSTSVNPRKIAEIALRTGAVQVVVSHNHPRGFAIPSKADITTTLELRDILKKLSVYLVDHLIFSASDNELGYDFVSMGQSGFL